MLNKWFEPDQGLRTCYGKESKKFMQILLIHEFIFLFGVNKMLDDSPGVPWKYWKSGFKIFKDKNQQISNTQFF
jgi:hypothetical protein